MAQVPQVLSAFVPTPPDAYSHGASPERVAQVRRGEKIGGAVSMSIALVVSLAASRRVGAQAVWIFLGSAGVLALMLAEYERAYRAATAGGQV